jgi:hypothetical protein
MAKIEINGKSFDTEDMSDDAKKMFNALRIADVAIKRTQAQLMLAQTAKNTYLKSLEQLLNK